MIAHAALAALAVAAGRPVVQTVVLERDATRPTVTVTASEPLPTPDAERRDDRLTFTWDAELSPHAAPPLAQPPIRAIRLVPRDGRLAVELTVDPAVAYGVETDGPRVRVVFGPLPPAATDVAALWVSLFPALTEPEPLEAPPIEPAASGGAGGDGEDGIAVGSVRLRPAIEASYVSADSTFESPQPTHDDYFELRPRLGALAPVGTGALNADYEGRWRRGSTFPEVEDASHLVNGGLALPVGSRLTLGVTDHFAVGTLETREVDPGGEYFFGLGRYKRNRFGLQARLATAGRFSAEAAAAWEAIEVDDASSFFDYDRRTLELRLGYELAPRLTAALTLAHDRIPTPSERPVAQSSARALGLLLTGELGPLTTAEIELDLLDQDTPLAAAGGREFRGLVLGARLRRQLGRESTLLLEGSRASFPSSFEGNAFYLASAVSGELDTPLPAAFVLRLAAGYHWNDYRTPAALLTEPRRDRFWDGAIGLGRPITRRAWVRADYRRERRDSNLDAFDTTIDAFTIQVGAGYLGGPGR